MIDNNTRFLGVDSSKVNLTEKKDSVNNAVTQYYTAEEVSGKTYKVYTALLTQEGENAPVATILENTADLTVTYFYNGVGVYTFGFSKLSSEKILIDIFGKSGIYGNIITYNYTVNPTGVNGAVAVAPSGPSQDGAMVNQPIEIRVYN